jgi:branched-chain amino acid transport system permease protein
MTATLDRPTSATAAPRQRRRQLGRVGVAVAVLAAVTLPGVVNAYVISVASTAIVLATLAMSTQLLTGIAGLPSLGQAAYLGVGAYTAALLAQAGVSNGPLHLAAAAVTGAGAAALGAPLVLRTRGTTFLMVTFAVGELARTVASKWATVTGGDEGLHLPSVTVWPGSPPLNADGYVYLYLLGCFLLVAATVGLLLRSRLVLVLRAAADHEPRAAALGHHLPRALVAGYCLAGGIAGTAGAMLVAANRYLSPADMSFDMSALALLAAAIGAGSMRGAVAGAALVVAVRDLAGTPTGGHALALLGAAFLLVAYRRPVTARLHTWIARRRP